MLVKQLYNMYFSDYWYHVWNGFISLMPVETLLSVGDNASEAGR